MLEFPSCEQAAAWCRSPQHAPLLAMRMGGDRWNLILVGGLDEDGDPHAALSAAPGAALAGRAAAAARR